MLIYPGRPAPVPSLRLEAIRDGIQDANVLGAYAARFGHPALVRLLARNGLFRARGGRLLLGCVRRCELRTKTKYAWPVWQRDEARASAGLARVRQIALVALLAMSVLAAAFSALAMLGVPLWPDGRRRPRPRPAREPGDRADRPGLVDAQDQGRRRHARDDDGHAGDVVNQKVSLRLRRH